MTAEQQWSVIAVRRLAVFRILAARGCLALVLRNFQAEHAVNDDREAA